MFPGMGADERLFGPQIAAGLPIEVPPQVMPERGDDMQTYAARVRDTLNLEGSYALGGVSLGGMIACEVAQLCQPKCLVLVATCRSGRSIPNYYRIVELLSRLFPTPLIQRRCGASCRLMAALEKLDNEQYELLRDMSSKIAVPFLRRTGKMVVNWNGPNSFPCPVRHIHGAGDPIIPIRYVKPDEVIPDGKHLINMTHPEIVNRFVEQSLSEA
jgi:pimeloyl-ACP methyl ester carboxylesterase